MHEGTRSTGGSVSGSESTREIPLERQLPGFNHHGVAFEDWLKTCAEVTKFLTGVEPDFEKWDLSKKIMRCRSEMPVYIPNGVNLDTAVGHMVKMGFDVSGINSTRIIGFCMGQHDETLLRINRSSLPDPKPIASISQRRRVVRYYANDDYLSLLGWIYATILYKVVTGSSFDSGGTFTATPSDSLNGRCLYVGVVYRVVTVDIMANDTMSRNIGRRLVKKVKFN